MAECTERPPMPALLPGEFWAEAWRGPSRPCVWCGTPCWDSWQQCNKHSNHPWRGLAWWRMRARIRMHDRWNAQYVRRHPEHSGEITPQILALEAAAQLAWRESRHTDQRALERDAIRLREKVIRVWSGLRADRLRWFWSGGTAHGWTPNLDRAWGLLPRRIPLQEAIRRSGHTNDPTLESIRRHSATALGIARGYMRKLPRGIPREDIEQAALIGLWEWKRSHPDEQTPGWIGGLRLRIRGSIIDELRNQAPFSRYAHRAVPLFVDGLDDALPGWEDYLTEERADPCERIDAQRIVAEAMTTRLTKGEATVIDLVYYRHLKQAGVAHALCVTEPRASQLRTQALAKMRAKLKRSGGFALAKCGPKEER